MIVLTDHETGRRNVYVRHEAITSMRRLQAVEEDDECEAIAARTRIDTATDMFLVVETPLKIDVLSNHNEIYNPAEDPDVTT